MNIIQFTPSPTYPPERGGQQRTHGLLTDFLNQGDVVHRITQGGEIKDYLNLKFENTTEIESNYTETNYLNPLYDLTSIPVLFDFSHVLLDWSLRLYRPNDIKQRIEWADVVIVEGPWQVRAVAKYLDDIPLIYSSHNVEIERFNSIQQNTLGKLFYKFIRKAEAGAIKTADLVACTSQRDLELYKKEYGGNQNYIVLPNGLLAENFQSTIDAQQIQSVRRKHDISDDDFTVVFMGSGYEPNVEGVKSILDQMRSNGQWKEVELLLIGRVCDHIDSDAENVHLAGFVDDLEAHLSVADAYINPIISGSGTNIKMIEYFAREKPIISTQFGVRGLDISDGEEVIITELGDFHTSVNWIREHPDKAKEIAKRGKDTARSKYTWENISSKYRSHIEDLVSEKKFIY